MNTISLGQYYPAASFLHRMDPRAKVISTVLYIVVCFLCKNLLSFLLLALAAVLISLISRIPLKIILGSMKALIFIMLFTAVINVFLTVDDEVAPLFAWKFITIYKKGLYQAAFILIRIISMIVVTSLFLTYTTTPIELTDALESLLRPLSYLHVPVHTFSMMMTIALRFIPTIMDETERLISAQKARGADFSSGSLVKRAKALIPIIVPLFASAFRRADELATAMECRCYRGGEGRTRLHVLRFRFGDFVPMVLLIALGTGIVLINHYGIGNDLSHVFPR